jgi:AcrR family transcriptional regulator
VTVRTRNRRGQGELLRTEILDATGRLLAELGDENAVSIRMIADAVGVTPPSIYLHFPDKDTLIDAVCEARFTEFDAALEAAGRRAAKSKDPLAELRERGRAYVRFGLANPEHYRVIFMTKHQRSMTIEEMLAGSMDGEPRAGAKAFSHVVGAVVRAADAGAIRANDPFVTSILLWSGLHGIVSLLISEPGFPWPPVEVLVESLLDMQEQ